MELTAPEGACSSAPGGAKGLFGSPERVLDLCSHLPGSGGGCWKTVRPSRRSAGTQLDAVWGVLVRAGADRSARERDEVLVLDEGAPSGGTAWFPEVVPRGTWSSSIAGVRLEGG